jgi:hypothetical protein
MLSCSLTIPLEFSSIFPLIAQSLSLSSADSELFFTDEYLPYS